MTRCLTRWLHIIAVWLCLAAPAAAEPALWRVADDDTQMYLFGTVHILHPDADWLAPETAAALDAADTLVLETELDPAAQRSAARLAEEHSYLPQGETLSGLMSNADYDLFRRAADSVNLNAAHMDTLRPWMASLSLSLIFAQLQGQDAEIGADRVLMRRAQESGADLVFLESPEDQIAIFAGLSRQGELDMLAATAVEIVMTPDILDTLDEAWLGGDVETLSDLAAEGMRKDAPELYEAALAERNRNWTGALTALMGTPGTVFVAVGAAHLAGPDSLQILLEEQGLAVERVR